MSYYTDLDNDLGVDEEVNAHFRAVNDKEHADRKRLMIFQYNENVQAELRTTIKCPYCKKSILKRTYNRRFCSTQCKDKYHNYTNSARLARAQAYKGK